MSVETVAAVHHPKPARDFTPQTLWALVVLGIFNGFNLVDRSIFSVNLEQIKIELHASDFEMSVASGIAFFLFNAAVGIPLARLADVYSRRNIIATGFAFYSLIMAVIGFATSFGGLLVARMLQGAGEASGTAPSSAMVNDLVSPANRRKALAGMRVFSSMLVLGMLSLVGSVSADLGWRASFYVLAVPAAIVVPLLLFTVKDPPHEGSQAGGKPPRITYREAWQRWKHSPAFLLVLLGFAVSGVTLQANAAWAGAFLARVHELSPREIGTLAGISRGPALLVGALFAGWITDALARRDHRWRFWVPALMLMLGTPCELVYLMADPYWIWAPAYLLTGVLLMGSQACAYAVCMDVSGPGLRATGLAFAILLTNLFADLIGPTIIGVLNDTVLHSYGRFALRYSMGSVALLALVGGILMFTAAWFETEDQRSG